MPKVKRAVSLPKELDSYLRGIAKESGRSYSGLVTEAIGVYRKSLERSRMAQAYAEHYADEERAKRDAAYARELANASAAGWPDWEP